MEQQFPTDVPRGTQAMVPVPHCPICASTHCGPALSVADHFLTQERFTLTDCGACGFRFTAPRPHTDQLPAYYKSEAYISHSNRDQSIQAKLYRIARRLALAGKYRTIRRYHPQGRVLDIGCGTGDFLAYLMGRGYQVEGVEPSVEARTAAIADHGIPVVPEIGALAPGKQFQVITLWHVLEHVPYPHATLKQIHALLAPGGLLIIAVPDRESWDCAYYGPNWAAWDVPRHLCHFRRADIHRLLTEHGFRAPTVMRMWLDAPYIAMLSEKYLGRSGALAFIKGGVIGAWSNWMALVAKHPTSSSLYLAKKA